MGLIWIFLATAGWIVILHEKTDLPAAFCPVAAVAVQVLFLYLLSLLGLLKSGPVILGVMAVLFDPWCSVLLRVRRSAVGAEYGPGA